MKPQEHELVRELFHILADLPQDQRREILRARRVPSEIVEQVESLLHCDENLGPDSVGASQSPGNPPPLTDPKRLAALFDLFKGALGQPEEEPSEERIAKDSRTNESFFRKLRRIYGEEADPKHTLIPEPEGPPAQMPDHPGPQDRYEFRGAVAEGGMGKILRVWDRSLRRYVAMKVIGGSGSSDRARPSSPSASFVRRFVEEAQISGQLEHPGVVPVHELALDEEGEVFFTMRLIQGITFKEAIKKVHDGMDGWTLTRALSRLLRVCETMAFAHTRGVVHRDLKPANIMLGDYGETYVMDWGLVKILGQPDRHDRRAGENERGRPSSIEPGSRCEEADSPAGRAKTRQGEVIGTPVYMPPEQAGGDQATVGLQADVYAVGAVMYHLLSGHPPFVPRETRLSAQEVIDRVLEGPPKSLSNIVRGAPEELIAICEKAMARDIEDRYPDMGAMAEDVRAYLEQRVVQAHRTGAVPEFRKWVARNKVLVSGLAATIMALTLGLVGTLVGLRQATVGRNEASQARDRLESVVDFRAADLRNINVSAMGSRMLEELREEYRNGLERESLTDEARRRALLDFENNLGKINSVNLARDIMSSVYLERAVERIDKGFSEDPVIESRLRESLAMDFKALGLYEKCLQQEQIVLDLRRKSLGEDHPDVLSALREVGSAFKMMGRLAEAEPYHLDALEGRRRILGHDHRQTLVSLNDLADLFRRMRRFSESEECYREVLEKRIRLLGEDDRATLLSMNDFGVLLVSQEKSGEGLQYLEQVLEKNREILGPDHPTTRSSLNNVMSALFNVERFDLAEEYGREVLESYLRLEGGDHPFTIRARNNLGRVLFAQEKYEEAETLLRVAHESSVRVLPPENEVRTKCLSNLVDALTRLSRPEEAETLCRELLAVRRAMDPPPIEHIALSLEQLGICLLDQEEFEEAEAMLRKCIKIRNGINPYHWSTHKARSLLGAALNGQGGRYEEAEALLSDSLDGMRERQDEIPKSWREAELRAAADRRDALEKESSEN